MEKRPSRLTRSASALMAIMPILEIYKIGLLPVTGGDVACLYIVLISFFDMFTKKINIRRCYFLIYFYCFFLVSLLMLLVHGQFDMYDFVAKWGRILEHYIIIDISTQNRIDRRTFEKWSLGAGTIASVLLLVQVIARTFFSMNITYYLNVGFLSLNYSLQAEEMAELLANYGVLWRPVSIFTEPSAFACFTLMPLAIALFSDGHIMPKKKRMFFIVLFSAAILLSKSANGFFVMSLLFVFWYFNSIAYRLTPQRLLLLILIAILAVILLMRTDFLNSALLRLQSVKSTKGTTGTQRLLQGFAIFSKMPVLEKLFGTGYGNYASYVISHNIMTAYVALDNEYMNSFSAVLTTSGLVGLVAYLAVWFKIYAENPEKISRAALLVITVLFCTTSGFYSANVVTYLGYVRCPKQTEADTVKKGCCRRGAHHPGMTLPNAASACNAGQEKTDGYC